MSEFLPYIVIGLVTGSVYGLVASGLVLTYRTSGIFNFAQGAIAAAAAYCFYWLYVINSIPWVWAFVLSLFVFGPIVGLLFERIAKNLSRQRTAMKIVGTVGLILIVEGLSTIKFGPDPLNPPEFLPKANDFFRLGGANVTYSELYIFLIAVVSVGILYFLMKKTRFGLAMRAVVDDPELVSLHATSPRRVRSYAWIIGSSFAALSGILVAPMVGLQSINLTYLVVEAFGAAAIGLFASIPLTFLGGLLIGVGAAVSTKYVVNINWLTGFPDSFPFLVLIIVLLVTPRRKLAPSTRETTRSKIQWSGPPAGRAVFGIFFLVVLLVIPTFAGDHLIYYIVGLSEAILLLSLGLLVRTAGMVSLCQAVFAGIGAVAFSQFVQNFHISWFVAVVLGALVVVPIAALLALPAIRLSGLFLALATFGFGIMVEQMFYPLNFMFTTVGGGRFMPRPSFGKSDNQYYYVVLAVLVLCALAMYFIHRSRLGRLLQGLSESPTVVNILGLNTSSLRVLVFSIAGFFAGLSGILYGCTVSYAATSDPYYASFFSLTILAVLALSPFREPWYAVFAIISAVIPGYFHSALTTSWLNVAFGVFAVMVALQGGTVGMPKSLQLVVERVFAGWKLPHFARRSVASPVPVARPELSKVAQSATGLRVENLVVRYGGRVALQDVSIDAPVGRITGLIGPNGAGKTTLFNACSGIVRPAAGKILFNDEDVTKASPSTRGRRGLGRTFQLMQLCDSLTVSDNVLLGCEAGQAGAMPWNQIAASPRARRFSRNAVDEAMELCGITSIASKQAGGLSTGERRLVELARCVAGSFDLLLLDEPSSGLDPEETNRFGETLMFLVAQRRSGILLVEHDTNLVREVCSYVYVLDFGRMLYQGEAGEVMQSDVVKAAYLGTEFETATDDAEVVGN